MTDLTNLVIKYEYVTHEDKKKVIEVQLRELEITHFGLLMTEPSKLNPNSQERQQWKQQKSFVETSIKNLRKKKLEFFGDEEE